MNLKYFFQVHKGGEFYLFGGVELATIKIEILN